MSSNRTNGTKPAIQHTKSILDDRRIRLLLAIVGAIVAWMVVTIVVQPGTTRTINNVPVDFTYDSAAYTSRGLSIVSAPEKYVSLKLSGDGYTIGSLTSSDFVVYPDWSGVRDSGEKTLHLQVRGVNTLLNGVSVSIEGGDNSVDVVFDVVEEKTVPITVTTNYLTIADGYILYGTELSKETVTLSGPSTEIDKVETCTAEVTHKGELTDSVTLDTALRFYTKSGSEVKFEYTNLEESSVEVTLEVYKMATLPVSVSFINAPRNFDPSVLVYSLSKQTLNVAGPESQIEKLSTLSVGTIDLSTFALNKVYELPIELPGNIRLLDNISSITASFDSSKLETKTMNLPASCVQVINLPSTYTLTVQTERLMNVTLCGPAGLLDTLVPEQVVIEIDADDFYVAAGQQNIACRLYVPSNGKIFALGSYVIQCRIESNCAGSPSQSRFACQLSRRESPWHKDEVCKYCQGLPLWGRWHCVSNDGEGEEAENRKRNLIDDTSKRYPPAALCRGAAGIRESAASGAHPPQQGGPSGRGQAVGGCPPRAAKAGVYHSGNAQGRG